MLEVIRFSSGWRFKFLRASLLTSMNATLLHQLLMAIDTWVSIWFSCDSHLHINTVYESTCGMPFKWQQRAHWADFGSFTKTSCPCQFVNVLMRTYTYINYIPLPTRNKAHINNLHDRKFLWWIWPRVFWGGLGPIDVFRPKPKIKNTFPDQFLDS